MQLPQSEPWRTRSFGKLQGITENKFRQHCGEGWSWRVRAGCFILEQLFFYPFLGPNFSPQQSLWLLASDWHVGYNHSPDHCSSPGPFSKPCCAAQLVPCLQWLTVNFNDLPEIEEDSQPFFPRLMTACLLIWDKLHTNQLFSQAKTNQKISKTFHADF